MTDNVLKWRRPLVGVCGIGLFFLVVVYGFGSLLTQFADYDDEGSMLFALAGVEQGRTLFDEVPVAYGPALFQLYSLPFEVFTLDTDSGRLWVVCLGFVLVSLCSFIAWWITRSTVLTLASIPVAALVVFSAVSSEPLHPVSLTMLLYLTVVASVSAGHGRSPVVWGLVAGAAIAILILVKVNLGLYLLAAVMVSYVLVSNTKMSRVIRWPVSLGVVLMPFLVANKQLLLPDREEALQLVLLIAIATGILVMAGNEFRGTCTSSQRGWSFRWVRGALVGGMIATAVSALLFLSTEGDIADLVEGVIVAPLRLGSTFYSSLDLPFGIVGLAMLAAVVCFWLLSSDRQLDGEFWKRGRGIARLGIGVGILICLVLVGSGQKGAVALPLVLAWVVLLPRQSNGRSNIEGFPRLLLPSVAVIGTLGMFPIAGSQVPSAALLFLPVAMLCISDGFDELSGAVRAGEASERFSIRTLSLARIAILAAVVPALLVAAVSAIADYRAGFPIPQVEEASRLRLDLAQAEDLGTVVEAVREEGCTSLVTYPIRASLVLWSGLEAESPMALQNWPWVYSREQQERLVRDARRTKRPCLLRMPEELELEGGICSAGPWSPRVSGYICGKHGDIRKVASWELLVGYPK